ncbi:hypothetical protein HPB50_004876 [Hyalomma asiaticum]|uniref:Uncharacterized protein n=1 Tax=Hyalomma asiaticum TaxID=266040 RepID=A0ACB7SGS5_HYAAI|nr:hypothetical protein HPB50_004876 [Hyalomma asiaticum]
MQCYARYPDESWSSSFLRSPPPLDTTLSPCSGVPPQPAPTSHSGRRPPHDCKLDNPGLGWFLRRLGIAAPLGATTQTIHWGPTSRGSGAVPLKSFLRGGTRRSPWPLTHLKRPASFAPLVEYPKYTGANTRTGPFTKLASPPLRVNAGPASRRPPPLLP